MENTVHTVDEPPRTSALLDVVEPDAAFLIAAEKEDTPPARRRALVVLVADHVLGSGEDTDRLVTELLVEAGFAVDAVVSVRSKKSQIRQAIETAVVGGVDLVLTVGGTGVGPRDKTPEATRSVLDQLVPGIAQALRSSGLACGAVDACTSRGISGVSGSTVVVNLAGSRAAVRDGMATLTLDHELATEPLKLQVRSVLGEGDSPDRPRDITALLEVRRPRPRWWWPALIGGGLGALAIAAAFAWLVARRLSRPAPLTPRSKVSAPTPSYTTSRGRLPYSASISWAKSSRV